MHAQMVSRLVLASVAFIWQPDRDTTCKVHTVVERRDGALEKRVSGLSTASPIRCQGRQFPNDGREWKSTYDLDSLNSAFSLSRPETRIDAIHLGPNAYGERLERRSFKWVEVGGVLVRLRRGRRVQRRFPCAEWIGFSIEAKASSDGALVNIGPGQARAVDKRLVEVGTCRLVKPTQCDARALPPPVDGHFDCFVKSRVVVGDRVLDEEQIVRTWPEGPGTWHAVAIYEVKDGLIAKVWFLFGAKTVEAAPKK
jgi:hypothetical protein